MQIGDWVVMPSKMKSLLHFGEITGEYVHDSKQGSPYFHHRKVKWFAKDIPRSNFDQDILYSLGAFLTVCRISRNDAEARIKAMAQNDWKRPATPLDTTIEQDEDGEVDLELMANDTIVRYIGRKFKGHGMARLVEAILKAKGYTTYISPEGPDKGIDILAAPEPLGFGRPRICVQVKTTDTPVDRPTLDQLIGVMQNSNAEQGLLVSWSGFKNSVHREIPAKFFKVRLWDQTAIIDELVACYDRLDEDIRAEIPLKRIWTLALPQDG
jgi:restriction system protein